MGVSEIRGYLLGVLMIRKSCYLGFKLGVPYFRNTPILV